MSIDSVIETETELELASLEMTRQIGQRIGRALQAGDVVALVGPLGAGKTHLTKAIATGLGLQDDRQVTSPTFVLIQEYAGRIPIYHFDAYRLADPGEFEALGVQDYFQADGVCLVEWADRVWPALPAERLEAHLTVTGPDSRRLRLLARGAGFRRVFSALTVAE